MSDFSDLWNRLFIFQLKDGLSSCDETVLLVVRAPNIEIAEYIADQKLFNAKERFTVTSLEPTGKAGVVCETSCGC